MYFVILRRQTGKPVVCIRDETLSIYAFADKHDAMANALLMEAANGPYCKYVAEEFDSAEAAVAKGYELA